MNRIYNVYVYFDFIATTTTTTKSGNNKKKTKYLTTKLNMLPKNHFTLRFIRFIIVDIVIDIDKYHRIRNLKNNFISFININRYIFPSNFKLLTNETKQKQNKR